MGILLLLLLFLIYRKSPGTCLVWMIVAYPTISLFYVFNRINPVTLMSFLFLLKILGLKDKINLKGYRTWFLLPTIISVISYLGSYYFTKDKHITFLLPAISDMFLIYLMWFYRKEINIRKFLIIVLIYSSFICVYGIIEGITFYNPILSYLRELKLYNASEQRIDYVRFGFYRAQSLTVWCSIYGVVCSFAFLSLVYAYFNKLLRFNKFLILLIFLFLWGVLISGTRTVIAMTLIGSLAFIPYLRGKNKVIIPILLIIYFVASFTSGYLNHVLEAMLGNEDVGGSSQEMRALQLESVMTVYNNKLWGNGIGSMSDALEDYKGLLGGESILFSTLIERGTVGFVCLIGYAVTSIFFLFKKRVYFLLFWVVAFYFAKYNSLIPGLREFYVLMYFMPLFYYEYKIKQSPSKTIKKSKNANKNNYLP